MSMKTSLTLRVLSDLALNCVQQYTNMINEGVLDGGDEKDQRIDRKVVGDIVYDVLNTTHDEGHESIPRLYEKHKEALDKLGVIQVFAGLLLVMSAQASAVAKSFGSLFDAIDTAEGPTADEAGSLQVIGAIKHEEAVDEGLIPAEMLCTASDLTSAKLIGDILHGKLDAEGLDKLIESFDKQWEQDTETDNKEGDENE